MSMQDKKGILLESGTNELEIIEFQINKTQPDGSIKVGHYGINVAKVREIIKPPQTTDYPNAHPCISGIFNLRGKLIPLLDLAQWLGIPSNTPAADKRVIVTEFNQLFNGFMVDNVTRIYRMSWESVEAPSQFMETGNDCVVAVVRLENRLVMLLDFEKIIADVNPEANKYDFAEDTHVGHDASTMERRGQHTVMLVDDSSFIRRMLNETLRSAGYLTVTAQNGLEALELLQDEENALVDLLVTDIEMPAMDGFHLIKRLREQDKFRALPIIVFSSIISPENARKADAVGANEAITKPELSKLVQRVDSYLGI
ncbi:chemotaxis protein CheV [Chrysiogenes arsenatis]|uniref:chemotaxis protein CheV n=1 Tax=Chrysiogenes arsenatis TaxID=309797 RepID=UPI0004228076|nr:chemotaxis protein [Chrysiogenes arsenatis]